ncbi:MAG: rRNA maturation RNase YbeY [Candidatus Dormibacteraeota bacterium]|nr:rRNA maturation RNase YbeY [Candidatus Dormibacteraeota bacterium]
MRPRAQLTVLLTDDAELRALNKQFLDIDAPTDVLAFPGDDAAHRPPPATRVGDIAISVERAQAQASDAVAELRLLAVHGLLHCLGHGHAGRDEAAAMTAATRALLPDQVVPEL